MSSDNESFGLTLFVFFIGLAVFALYYIGVIG